jgi:hypothetical protein
LAWRWLLSAEYEEDETCKTNVWLLKSNRDGNREIILNVVKVRCC